MLGSKTRERRQALCSRINFGEADLVPLEDSVSGPTLSLGTLPPHPRFLGLSAALLTWWVFGDFTFSHISCQVQLKASPVLGGSVRHVQAEESFRGKALLAAS